MLRTSVLALVVLAAAAAFLAQPSSSPAEAADAITWLSPSAVACVPDGSALLVAEEDANRIQAVDPATGELLWVAKTPAAPTDIAVVGGTAWVCCMRGDVVVPLDLGSHKVGKEIKVGVHPYGITAAADGKTLYVCNRYSNDVSVVDLGAKRETARIPVVREPGFAALAEQSGTLVVANRLANGSNHEPGLAADITFIDTATSKVSGTLRLPTGCNEVEQVACSPDGEWAYVVSLLSRFLVPTTQIERGWINTNALSVIHVPDRTLLATVLLDDLDLGAANPVATLMAPDGKMLYITHRGSHEVTALDVARLHEVIGTVPAEQRAELANDLTFLYRNDIRLRYKTNGLGPIDLALSPDGAKLYTANHFSDDVSVFNTAAMKPATTLALGPTREMDTVRKGDLLFHDARLCFQQWQSCSSCHPDGRSDALMWDLMNDGLGNPKNAKSLLLSGKTPPSMAHGIRSDMRTAAEAGVKYILFRMPDKESVDALAEYIDAIEPDTSPLLSGGNDAKASIKRGKAIFSRKDTGCAECHPAPLYTDLETYDVGTRSQYDSESEFDTPTLIELFRNGPYMHDGTAVTLRDVLTTHNAEDKHGRTSQLSEQEITDLANFLGSL